MVPDCLAIWVLSIVCIAAVSARRVLVTSQMANADTCSCVMFCHVLWLSGLNRPIHTCSADMQLAICDVLLP